MLGRHRPALIPVLPAPSTDFRNLLAQEGLAYFEDVMQSSSTGRTYVPFIFSHHFFEFSDSPVKSR